MVCNSEEVDTLSVACIDDSSEKTVPVDVVFLVFPVEDVDAGRINAINEANRTT